MPCDWTNHIGGLVVSTKVGVIHYSQIESSDTCGMESLRAIHSLKTTVLHNMEQLRAGIHNQ